MSSLYNLSENYLSIMRQVEEGGGELSDELFEQLEDVEEVLTVKVENCCKYVRNLEGEIAGLDIELDRLSDRKKIAQNAIRNFKGYMQANLMRMDLTEVEAGTFKVSIQASGGAQKIEWAGEPESIPEPLRRITIELDKDKALELHKAGMELPSDLIVHERGKHLRIK